MVQGNRDLKTSMAESHTDLLEKLDAAADRANDLAGRLDGNRYHFRNLISTGKLRPGLQQYHNDLEKEFKHRYQDKLGETYFVERAKSTKQLLKQKIQQAHVDQLNTFIENFSK